MPELASLTADIVVENHGSVVLLRGLTVAGSTWLQENVHTEPWQWFGGAIAAEPRYVPDLIGAAQDDGLVVSA